MLQDRVALTAPHGLPDAPVTILMATRNGARHLPAQLASIAGQSLRNWQLWVSDDGSTDQTRDIVLHFAKDHPVRLMDGPGRGAAANFLFLLTHPDLPPGPVAFADQDDVWHPGKLARAMTQLASGPPDRPALYAADSVVVDARLRPRGRSLARRVRPGFANALVENVFSGHTMVLNRAAVALARRAGAPQGIRYHDWWLYQLIAGTGGRLCLDRQAVALYRQHRANVLGPACGPQAAMSRLVSLARGDWGLAMRAHATALRDADAPLLAGTRALLDAYLDGFAPRGAARVGAFVHHDLSRSAHAHTLALRICAFFGRV